jgi:hypothetical protein
VVRSSNQACADLSRFMSLFKQIISSVREILQHPSICFKRRSLDFEMQVVCPLFTVVQHCPDLTLRREARELASSWQHGEDFADSFQAAKLMQWVRLMSLAKWIRPMQEVTSDGRVAPEFLRWGRVDFLKLGSNGNSSKTQSKSL